MRLRMALKPGYWKKSPISPIEWKTAPMPLPTRKGFFVMGSANHGYRWRYPGKSSPCSPLKDGIFVMVMDWIIRRIVNKVMKSSKKSVEMD